MVAAERLDRLEGRSLPNITPVQGALIILVTGAIFSFGGLAFRLTDDISAWQYLIFRGIGAMAVAAVVLAYRFRGRFNDLATSVEVSHVVAGVLLGTISAIFIIALEFTTVAFILFLQALAPITAAYFSWILLRERVSSAAIIATVVSIVGVGIMVSGTVTDDVRPASLLALAIPIIFGLYATLIRRATTIDPLVPIAIGGLLLAVVGLLAVAAFEDFDVSLNDAAIGIFAGSALLAIPLSIFNLAQRVVPASESALLLMSEVVLAPLWVWIFVDETPPSTTLIGGAIIFVAVVSLIVWRRNQARRAT